MTEVTHLTPRFVARSLHRMSIAEEFTYLMAERQRISRRLDVLTPILEEALDITAEFRSECGPHTAPCALPKSGLRLVAHADGSLLFKGGPAA